MIGVFRGFPDLLPGVFALRRGVKNCGHSSGQKTCHEGPEFSSSSFAHSFSLPRRYLPQHAVFLPLPQGQGSLRPTFSSVRTTVCCFPSAFLPAPVLLSRAGGIVTPGCTACPAGPCCLCILEAGHNDSICLTACLSIPSSRSSKRLKASFLYSTRGSAGHRPSGRCRTSGGPGRIDGHATCCRWS